MQVADEFEVFDMLNGEELERVVKKHRPDIIVPEIEAIRTERLRLRKRRHSGSSQRSCCELHHEP